MQFAGTNPPTDPNAPKAIFWHQTLQNHQVLLFGGYSMKLIDSSIHRPVTVIICAVALMLAGLYVYTQMPMQKRPDMDFPRVTVVTTMPGANAVVMDSDIGDVLEDKLNGISGVQSLTTSSYPGRSVTVVEFGMDADINHAASDVRDKVSAAVGDLPEEADTPIVQKLDLTAAEILQLAITGTASEKEKNFYVDKILKTRLQSVSDVGTIEISGMRKREIRIWVDPAALHAYGLVMNDIIDAIGRKHVELPAGSILNARTDIDIRVNAEYATTEELKTLPVQVKGGAVVRLGEIARVEDGFAEPEDMAQFNGQQTIILGIRKQSGANEVKLSDELHKALADLKKTKPDNIDFTVIYNQADFVRDSISGAINDVMAAVLLCSILMFLFLQTFRATFVTVITIPVCILGSFIIMQKLKITLNAMSMMAISLSVGMVVDATTVVLENTVKHMHRGLGVMKAAYTGAQEVSFSVIGGVLTTVIVFSPIAFLSGVIGKQFTAFGLTIIMTISLSLLLSLTLTPFLNSRILEVTEPVGFAARCNDALSRLERFYGRCLEQAVNRRLLTIGIAVALFAVGIFLSGRIGSSFLPSEDEGLFKIDCELPLGSSLQETYRTLDDMGQVIRENENVAYTYATIGSGTGKEKNKGTIFVKLAPRSRRPSLSEVQDQLRPKTRQFKDVAANYCITIGKDFRMTLVGPTTEALLPVADKIMREASGFTKITDIESDVRMQKPEYNVIINRGLADIMNIDIRSLSTELHAIFGGQKAGVFKEDGYRYDIRIMADQDRRSELDSLDTVYIKNAAGQIMQANSLFTVNKTDGPNFIKRYNRQRSLTISANVTKDYSSGQAIRYMNGLARKYIEPGSGVRIMPTGASKYMLEDFERLRIAMIVAIFLVYVVMAIQFESFIHPLVVMVTLPLLTPGAFGLLFLSGCKLDMMSYMGLIFLCGIVVNNGIILVDFINRARKTNPNKEQAVIQAGPQRLRAILITACSTLITALPAALALTTGAEMRQSMSICVFGGLFTSTLLTLLVIPVVYLVFDDAKEWLYQKAGGIIHRYHNNYDGQGGRNDA